MRDVIAAEPFRIAVPDEILTDLKLRLLKTRWPIEAKAPPWTYGASVAYMRDTVDYWLNHYDWRKSETALNRFPNYKADLDGKQDHFILERGAGAVPLPLILTH